MLWPPPLKIASRPVSVSTQEQVTQDSQPSGKGLAPIPNPGSANYQLRDYGHSEGVSSFCNLT